MSSLDRHRENDCCFSFFLCLWFIVLSFCGVLITIGLIVFLVLPVRDSPGPATSVEIGGNVPVLLKLTGFDPLRYDQVQVTGLTAGSNTTLLLGLCEDLSTVRVPLRSKNFFFKSSTKSALPFNYFGGDTPVYSAGGNGSFIRFNISAELEATGGSHNDSHQSCGAQLINFDNLTSYMEFIDNQTTHQPLSNCISVGPPGSPSTTSVVFSLHEPGFYRQAVFVNTTLSINSSVTGSLSSYNTSSLEPAVLCNTENCTIHISTLPSTQNLSVCVLVLTGEYTVVKFRAFRFTSMDSASPVLTIATLLVSCFICCSCMCGTIICLTYRTVRSGTSQTVRVTSMNSILFSLSCIKLEVVAIAFKSAFHLLALLQQKIILTL